MRIIIETINHKDQRYNTCGDWQFMGNTALVLKGLFKLRNDLPAFVSQEAMEEKTLFVQVSKFGDWRYEFLVGIHEAIEAGLCKLHDVKGEDVDAFDIAFEDLRDRMTKKLSVHEGDFLNDLRGIESWRLLRSNINAEPGDCHLAPYYEQHQVATGIERILAAMLGVSWTAYEEACNNPQ